jgi:hypothetical protein
MKLQTQLTPDKAPVPISYNSESLLLGSCFAGHMAGKLAYYKFRTTLNPFGILFHPRAITNLTHRAINAKGYKNEELFFSREQWHCFEAHSDLSSSDQDQLRTELNRQLKSTRDLLSRASHLVITLGTAWGYVRKATGAWVANCHKVPQTEFEKVLSSPEEIMASLKMALQEIYKLNPEIAVIFTVSPVRHLKDGFVENQLSKAHLIVALHQLIASFPGSNIYYFPAYELMMDELRDYRFYESDMLHPNGQAIEYIWERFKISTISEKALPIMDRVEEIQKGLHHKAFNPGSEAHLAFTKGLQEKIKKLEKTCPYINFDSGLRG